MQGMAVAAVTARLEKADVLASLTAERVLAHFGVDARRSGGELRFQICPECGARSRWDAVSVSKETGLWHCKVNECRGDLLAMVAGYAGIDLARDFESVLGAAADIAGVAR